MCCYCAVDVPVESHIAQLIETITLTGHSVYCLDYFFQLDSCWRKLVEVSVIVRFFYYSRSGDCSGDCDGTFTPASLGFLTCFDVKGQNSSLFFFFNSLF